MKILLIVLLAVAASATEQSIDYSKVVPMYQLRPELWKNLPSEFKLESKIVGGQEAKAKQFPHQVGLFVHVSSTQTAFCGGSLITPNYVMTAAHCADIAQSFTVVLGAHEVHNEKEEGQIRIETSTKVFHPSWSPSLLRNDIALIKLPKAVTLNDRIQTIRLPKKSQASTTFENVEGTASGWGKPKDNASGVSPVLRFAKNKVLSNKDCDKLIPGIIQSTHVCFSGEGGRSTCSGDSGGPLTVVDKDNKVTQIGVTSFGLAAGCELGFPAGFTRVASYLEWIEQNSDLKLEK